MEKKAILLLSAGIDSTVTAAIAKSKGFDIYTLSFDYGQKNKLEISLAEKLSRILKSSEHLTIKTQIYKLGGSALTTKLKIPQKSKLKDKKIPITYVPGRNTIFLSYSLAWAEVLGCVDIFLGVNVVDYSGYPDCRIEYLKAFEKMANLGTKQGVLGKKINIHAPLINMSKPDIISKGLQLNIDFSKTTSCYDFIKNGKACGRCDSCIIRKEAFLKIGLTDPIEYEDIDK